MELTELQGFYVTEDDGYTALSYYSDPSDEAAEIVTAALEFTPGQGE